MITAATIRMPRPRPATAGLMLVMLALGAFHAGAQAAPPTAEVTRIFRLEAHLYSMAGGLDSVVNYSRGSIGGVSGELGLVCATGARRFETRVRFTHSGGKLLSTVIIEPHESDARTQGQTIDLDLTDLRPVALELAHDEDPGRVYFLKLVPLLEVIDRRAERFEPGELALHEFSFDGAPIIINDERFAGRFSASGGELAWMQLPGIGRVEFSLLPFRDAEPAGRLHAGQATLRVGESDTIQLSPVTNGTHEQVLPGGPYQLWVRHTPAEQPPEAAVDQMLAQVEALVAEGTLGEIDPAQLDRMLERVRQGHLIACGVRPLTDDER